MENTSLLFRNPDTAAAYDFLGTVDQYIYSPTLRYSGNILDISPAVAQGLVTDKFNLIRAKTPIDDIQPLVGQAWNIKAHPRVSLSMETNSTISVTSQPNDDGYFLATGHGYTLTLVEGSFTKNIVTKATGDTLVRFTNVNGVRSASIDNTGTTTQGQRGTWWFFGDNTPSLSMWEGIIDGDIFCNPVTWDVWRYVASTPAWDFIGNLKGPDNGGSGDETIDIDQEQGQNISFDITAGESISFEGRYLDVRGFVARVDLVVRWEPGDEASTFTDFIKDDFEGFDKPAFFVDCTGVVEGKQTYTLAPKMNDDLMARGKMSVRTMRTQY